VQRTNLPRFLIHTSLAFAVLSWARPDHAGSGARAADADAERRPLVLEDELSPLDPLRAPSDADRDRIESAALFSAARMKEQREDYPGALRLYQRALRYDPDAAPILREIVQLAFSLGRSAEAVRYAKKAAELEASDPQMLQRLATYLTDEGDLEGALGLYEKALPLLADQKEQGDYLLLRMEMGKLYLFGGKFDSAADAFAEVMQALESPEGQGPDAKTRRRLKSDRSATYELLGSGLLAAGRRDEATRAFQKAHELQPQPGILGFHLAQVRAAADEHAAALESLQEYLDSHQTRMGVAPYELLAQLLEKLGKSDELVPRLEKLKSDDAGNLTLAYFLAERYRESAQFEMAEPLLAHILAQNPGPEPDESFIALQTRCYRTLVNIYRSSKRSEPLLALLGQVMERDGNLSGLGEEGRALGEDDELMRGVVEAARARGSQGGDGLSFDQRLAVAFLAFEAKQADVASEFFGSAIEARRDEAARLLRLWGFGLVLLEKYEQAIEVFNRALAERVLPEGAPDFHYHLAAALEMAGRTDEALVAARKAAELAEKDADKLDDLALDMGGRIAWISYHAKRYDEARKSYEQLIEKLEALPATEKSRDLARDARLVLSNICVQLGDMPAAEEWLEQVLDEFPDDIAALNDLGYLWADAGKHLHRALRMVEQAVAGDADNEAYRDSLGWALYRLGRFEEAAAELQKAASVDAPDGVILDHLGDTLLKLNRPDEARAAWNRALEVFARDRDAEKEKSVREKLEALPASPTANAS